MLNKVGLGYHVVVVNNGKVEKINVGEYVEVKSKNETIEGEVGVIFKDGFNVVFAKSVIAGDDDFYEFIRFNDIESIEVL